jgi:signal transduction histidine kinase
MIRRHVAALLGLLAVVAAAAGVTLHLGTPAAARVPLFDTPEAAYGPAAAVVAVLLLWRRPANLPAWLLLGSGTAAAGYVAGRAGAAYPGTPEALAAAGAWLARWTWAPAYLVVVGLLPMLWPDGRPPSPRWRPAVAFTAAVLAVVVVGTAVDPAQVGGRSNPLGVPAAAAVVPALRAGFAAAVPLVVLLAVAALVVRFRRADPAQRRQIAWFGYAVALVAAVSFGGPWQLRLAASVAVPVAVGVAVTRHRLFDIDTLVSRTLLGGTVLGVLAVVYAAVAGWAGALLAGSSRLPAFAGAVAVALAFAPVRDRARRGVNRLLYGARADPYGLLTRVADRLQGAPTPVAALRVLAAEVAAGLRLPGVEVDVVGADGRTVSAAAGAPVGDAGVRLPLVWLGETIGALRAAPRRGTDRLDLADDAVLRELARQGAALAYAVRLSAELQHSRERVVAAREEERRRLRRDLHDGVGPQLAGVVMTLDAAAAVAGRGETARAAELVTDARDQARAAVQDVRRVVRGLRPPALDELGLVDAVRTTGPAAATGGPAITVEAADPLPTLPAAVEVAAYHVVQEAVTNAVRHGSPAAVRVRLAGEAGALLIEVADDGTGLPAGHGHGVGLRSMHDRVDELGGTLTIDAPPGGGTRVAARLPLPDQAG